MGSVYRRGGFRSSRVGGAEQVAEDPGGALGAGDCGDDVPDRGRGGGDGVVGQQAAGLGEQPAGVVDPGLRVQWFPHRRWLDSRRDNKLVVRCFASVSAYATRSQSRGVWTNVLPPRIESNTATRSRLVHWQTPTRPVSAPFLNSTRSPVLIRRRVGWRSWPRRSRSISRSTSPGRSGQGSPSGPEPSRRTTPRVPFMARHRPGSGSERTNRYEGNTGSRRPTMRPARAAATVMVG